LPWGTGVEQSERQEAASCSHSKNHRRSTASELGYRIRELAGRLATKLVSKFLEPFAPIANKARQLGDILIEVLGSHSR
jgi:hypothetical protein